MRVNLADALRVELGEALVDHLNLHESSVLGRRVWIVALASSLPKVERQCCSKRLRPDICYVELAWNLHWDRSLKLNVLRDDLDGNGHVFDAARDASSRHDVDRRLMGINHSNKPRSETFASYFDTEVELRSVSGFNHTERAEGNRQQGGTAILNTNTLLPYVKKTGTDFRGLGRWCWTLYQASKEHRTRWVQAYNLVDQSSEERGSVYQQHRREIQRRGLGRISPQELMRQELLAQLETWVKQGDRIILTMDANEHVLTGKLARELVNPARGLGLKEISHSVWGDPPPNTWIRGRLPIDGVWISRSLECTGFKMLGFRESAGDHRTMIFDITSRSLLGQYEHRVVRAGCRRLTTKNERCCSRYQELVEQQMRLHRMKERLDDLAAEIGDGQATADQARRLERLDTQMVEIQTYAERRCRKILKPDLEFSPEVKLRHERMLVWKALIRWKEGKPCDGSNVVRKAVQLKIPFPRQLSLEQAREGYAVAKAKKHGLRRDAAELRRQHLRECLMAAEARNDAEGARAVRQKADRERDHKMWYFINRGMRDPRGKPIVTVQKRSSDGAVTESTSQEETEEMIFAENEYRFQLASEAPISSTLLIEELGYLADTDITQQIIEGTFDIPDEVDDSTALILEEIGRIGVQLLAGDVCIDISPDEFRLFWKRARENTSSSISGIHFGHYKAAAKSDLLTEFLSKKITLIARTGCPPERWSYGLTVMLEKIAGLALVNRLRAILLMEADFNFHNRLIFGRRMLEMARANGLIPEEHYSEKDSTAEDGKFANILAADIARMKRQPYCTISADASNCYDRIHHSIMSLVFLAMRIPKGAIRSMLHPIQMMKFFLRTGWGESANFIGGDILRILHGLCQGNAAAPAAWLMLCSVIIRAYKRLGFGFEASGPISDVLLELMGIVYVDDTDLLIMKQWLATIDDLWSEAQQALLAWGALLIATGGTLKPEKCHFYMIGFECSNGEWETVSIGSGRRMVVPQPDGSSVPIEQLDVRQSKKTLGLFTNPAGECAKQVDVLTDKIQAWADRLPNARLPSSWAWVSYRLQLWSRLRFGLGTNASPLLSLVDIEVDDGPRPTLPAADQADVDEGVERLPLRAIYRRILPHLGINRNIKLEWRHLHSSFGGVGLRTLAVETMIGRTNLFLQHYGSASDIGISLQIALEQLHLEAGTLRCPLLEPYRPFGPFVTPSWVRSFWEGLSAYNFRLHFQFPSFELPRRGDVLLTTLGTTHRPPTISARSFHRCRMRWKALFLSDLTNASGLQIEPHFLHPPTDLHPAASRHDFPAECPTQEDWAAWAQFWIYYTGPGLSLRHPLGKWLHPTHRIWNWFYHRASNSVLHQSEADAEARVFLPIAADRFTRGGQQYRHDGDSADLPRSELLPCSVHVLSPSAVALKAIGPALAQDQTTRPDRVFWEYLWTWGGKWMWEDITNDGPDLSWVLRALREGTGIWVTDGSYNKATAPSVSGAGWIFYCRRSKLRLRGSFYEVSPKADSYRAEYLGLLAIHSLLAAIQSYFELTAAPSKICCDNQSALYKSSEVVRRVPTGAAQADIQRALRNVKLLLDVELTYEWVAGHQDRHKRWDDLTIEQQLNCFCDILAKGAVSRSIHRLDQRDLGGQHLPQEKAAVIVGGVKQTSDVGRDMRYELGRRDAEHFYVEKLHWARSVFRSVAWEVRDAALEKKTDNYRSWLAKQCAGFLGTQAMVSRWDSSRTDRCPNCEQLENSSHLLVCPDFYRTKLLRDSVRDFDGWLDRTFCQPDLRFWVTRYILLRGTRKLSSFKDLPELLRPFAAVQDAIGWRHFMEGKVARALFDVQRAYLAGTPCLLTAASWSRLFLSELLHVTHSQWLFRNHTLHDESQGYLKLQKRRDILLEIATLAESDPAELPADSRHLLEIDFNEMATSSLETQSYWLLSFKAARIAGRRRAIIHRRRGGNGASARRLAKKLGRRLRPALSLGTREVEAEIERHFGQRPSRKHSLTSSTLYAHLGSNKRRKPD